MVAALVAATIAVAGTLYLRSRSTVISPRAAAQQAAIGCSQASAAFRGRQNHEWITISAPVVRILPDEYGTYQHQRFIVRCPSGQTVLITNDVSVGSRVPVAIDTPLVVHGEYIWNAQGGLVHFTHHGGANGGGWILFRGKVYAGSSGGFRLAILTRG